MRTHTYLRSLLFLGSILFFGCGGKEDRQVYDMVIRNGWIHDGTGSEPYYGQVLVNGEKIVKIDPDTSKIYQSEKVVDARGKVLSPGFIDSHAHGDPLQTPAFENFLAMGVTTIFLGQDGSSPNTPDLAAWMDTVDQIQPGVNIGMSVGHGTLRSLSGVNYDKPATGEGISEMERLLVKAMEAGSFGLSTGLEYNPGYLANQEELNRLAKVVGQHGGMVMSHMRNEDDDAMESSIGELMGQGDYCPVHVSHIKVVYAKGEARAREILAILEKERQLGKTVTADIYPYEASYTGISLLFPDWAKPPAVYKEVVDSRRQELETYLKNRVNLRNGPEATLIGNGPFKGMNLKEIADQKGKAFEKVLVEDIGPSGTSAAYFVMDEQLMKTFLKDAHINICSDGSPTSNHPRGYGTFAKIIEAYVVKDSLLTLPESIYKMTGLSAQNMGIRDRGKIAPGYFADILIFDPLQVKANATYEAAAQLASGFDWVLINGKIAREKTTFSSTGAGRIIRKPLEDKK